MVIFWLLRKTRLCGDVAIERRIIATRHATGRPTFATWALVLTMVAPVVYDLGRLC